MKNSYYYRLIVIVDGEDTWTHDFLNFPTTANAIAALRHDRKALSEDDDECQAMLDNVKEVLGYFALPANVFDEHDVADMTCYFAGTLVAEIRITRHPISVN